MGASITLVDGMAQIIASSASLSLNDPLPFITLFYPIGVYSQPIEAAGQF